MLRHLERGGHACEVLDFQERKQYPERGIRTPDWLYVERCGVPAVLFDRKNDKYEQFNLVTDPYSLEQMEQLKSALKRKMAETNDSWDIQAKYPPEDVFVKRKCEQKGPKKVSTFSTRFHVVSNVFPKYQMLTF